MSDDWRQNDAFSMMLMAGACLLGACCGHEIAMSQFRQEAVDKGHAEYDSKTTEFKWLPIAEKAE